MRLIVVYGAARLDHVPYPTTVHTAATGQLVSRNGQESPISTPNSAGPGPRSAG
jgi:hypothetical protein